MQTITATERPLIWAARHNNAVSVTGITRPGETTASIELVSGAGEPDALAAMQPYADEFPALPDSGWLEAGDIYNANGALVMVRQSHQRTIYAPSETPALFVVYRADAASVLDWVAGERVEVGTLRTYEGVMYQCLQAHVTQQDWQPPNVPALWSVYTPPSQTDEWQVGVSYQVGDVVTYDGAEYECRQAHTSQAGWEPPNVLALWLPL